MTFLFRQLVFVDHDGCSSDVTRAGLVRKGRMKSSLWCDENKTWIPSKCCRCCENIARYNSAKPFKGFQDKCIQPRSTYLPNMFKV